MLVLDRGVVDEHLEHEAVDLRLGQRIRALGLDRVLRRHDEERALDDVRRAADRDRLLLHDLEQRRLHLRGRAVDLVGEQEVREDRAELGVERARVRAVDARADEVGGHEVGRELDALEGAAEHARGSADRERLGEAGDALDQQVAAGEQAHEHPLEHLVLPGDHSFHLEQGCLDRLTAFARGVEAGKTALLWHGALPRLSLRALRPLKRFLQENSGSLEEA